MTWHISNAFIASFSHPSRIRVQSRSFLPTNPSLSEPIPGATQVFFGGDLLFFLSRRPKSRPKLISSEFVRQTPSGVARITQFVLCHPPFARPFLCPIPSFISDMHLVKVRPAPAHLESVIFVVFPALISFLLLLSSGFFVERGAVTNRINEETEEAKERGGVTGKKPEIAPKGYSALFLCCSRIFAFFPLLRIKVLFIFVRQQVVPHPLLYEPHSFLTGRQKRSEKHERSWNVFVDINNSPWWHPAFCKVVSCLELIEQAAPIF